jgi:hypothetical protein
MSVARPISNGTKIIECAMRLTGTGCFKKRGFQPSSDTSSSWLPLTQNLANRAMVRSTISLDFETIIDLRLKGPNQ